MMRRGGAAVLAAMWLAACATTKGIPEGPVFPELRPGRWAVRHSAPVDLWYHGLAIVGFGRDAPLPLYGPDYADMIRAVKEAAGVYPSALDRQAETFRLRFERDRAFQSLHFGALHFRTVGEMDEVVGMVVEGGGKAQQLSDPRLALAAQWFASSFPRRAQRELLGRWVDALREEWNAFYFDYWERLNGELASQVQALDARWNSAYGPRLGALLSYLLLDEGTIFVVPALGPEGRSFPLDRRENWIAVAWDPERDSPDAPLHRAVREICFAFSSDVVTESTTQEEQRTEGARFDAMAAVRAGAIVLERVAPDLVPGYRDTFVRAVGRSGDTEAEFAAAFPLPDRVVDGLERRVDFLLSGL